MVTNRVFPNDPPAAGVGVPTPDRPDGSDRLNAAVVEAGKQVLLAKADTFKGAVTRAVRSHLTALAEMGTAERLRVELVEIGFGDSDSPPFGTAAEIADRYRRTAAASLDAGFLTVDDPLLLPLTLPI